jgi:uncharacterized protein YlxP (DUF503 family)
VRSERVHHAVALLHLRLPGATSLKDRRAHLQRLRRALVDELGCSVAEVGGRSEHRRAVLGIAVVASAASGVERVVERLIPLAERDPGVEVIGLQVRHDTLHEDD